MLLLASDRQKERVRSNAPQDEALPFEFKACFFYIASYCRGLLPRLKPS
jgi:hypothetical protein